MMKRILVGLFSTLVLAVPATALGAGWDAFPSLPSGEHAAVKSSIDGARYDELRECLKTKDSPVDAEYYAAIVEVTARSGSADPAFNNAVPYVDALYQAWKSNGRLDPDTHVLIALGLENRAVAIHPGNDWVQLGFEKGVITRTIDRSSFKRYARSGDYAKATCQLAEAVDQKLESLMGDLEDRKERLRSKADKLLQGRETVSERIGKLEKYSDVLKQNLEPRLKQAAEKLEEAKSRLDRGMVASASEKVRLGESIIRRARAKVTRYRAALTRLPDMHERVDSLQAQIDERPGSGWFSPTRAKETLKTCRSRVEGLEEDLSKGVAIESALSGIEHCFGEVESNLESADTRAKIMKVYVPAGGGGALLVFFLIFGYRRRSEHNRQASMLRQELAEWDTKLSNASSRLMELEQTYPFYFSAGTERWEGESAELDQECANAVNHAYLLYSEATKLQERAQTLLEECGAFSITPLEKGWSLLHDKTITFETGETEDRRKIFLPLTRKYEGTAGELLSDLDARYNEAMSRLDEVQNVFKRAGDLSTKARQTTSSALDAVQARKELELPFEHLSEPLKSAHQRYQKAESLVETDPVQATEIYEEIIPKVEGLQEQATSGNEMVEAVRGRLAERGKALRGKVEELRNSGFEVEEPGFNPDVRLDRTRRDARRVEQLVRDGSEEEAESLFAEIEPAFDELERMLETIEEAREAIPEDVDEIEQARTKLQKRIPEAKEILGGLKNKYAPATFAAESNNLNELEGVLEELASWTKHIRADHEKQHYLSATADVETARRLIEEGKQLLDAIDQIEEDLAEAVDTSKKRRGRARDLVNRLESVFEQETRSIPDSLRQAVSSVEEKLAAIVGAMDEPRPNWIDIREGLGEAVGQLETHLSRAETMVEKFREAQELRAKLGDKVDRLVEQVEAETRDRPFVGKAAEQARQQFEAWVELFDDSSVGGISLLRRGKSAQNAYQRARQKWESERDLIETYEAEIARAEDRFSRNSGMLLGYGVHVDCSDAGGTLTEARTAANNRNWDEAVVLAEQAQQEVDTAVDEAWDDYDDAEAAHESSTSYSSSTSTSSTSFSSFSGGSSFSSSSSFSGGSSFGGSSSGGSSW